MTNATFIAGKPDPTIRLERTLPDPPSVVWRSLTDREELRSWFPCDVIVNGGTWVPGATITFEFPTDIMDLTLRGEVHVVDEPHVLSYTWGDELLRFELHPHGSGTRLILTDQLARDRAARNAAGWEDCLDRLVGIVPVEGSWQPHFELYREAFESALGPQSGLPDGYHGDDQP